MKKSCTRSGISLIETILTLGVIALLIGLMIFVINPGKQLRDARDAQRQADVTNIAEAIIGFMKDNNGTLPAPIRREPALICRSGVNIDCGDGINLNILTGAYLRALPADPVTATMITTGYAATWDGTILTILAPAAEEKVISVERRLLMLRAAGESGSSELLERQR